MTLYTLLATHPLGYMPDSSTDKHDTSTFVFYISALQLRASLPSVIEEEIVTFVTVEMTGNFKRSFDIPAEDFSCPRREGGSAGGLNYLWR